MSNMYIHKFVSTANKLDKAGFYTDADAVDAMILKMTRISFHMPWQHDGEPRQNPYQVTPDDVWHKRIEEHAKMQAEIEVMNQQLTVMDKQLAEKTTALKDAVRQHQIRIDQQKLQQPQGAVLENP